MSGLDMAEAVRMLAADKGISVDTLLQVLADALVSAYKRRCPEGGSPTVFVNLSGDICLVRRRPRETHLSLEE